MHDYREDEFSALRNCQCGAERESRVHPHQFRASGPTGWGCSCGLSASADCHTSQIGRDLATIMPEEIKAAQKTAPRPVLAYPDSVANRCGHSGGIGIGAGHICGCNRAAFHPIDSDRPHGCECGALWADEPSEWTGDLPRVAPDEGPRQ